MNNQLFHDYRIQHSNSITNNTSPLEQSIQYDFERVPSKQNNKLKENLMILNQFFVENPVNMKPNPKVVKHENLVESNIDQNTIFLNLSAFKMEKEVLIKSDLKKIVPKQLPPSQSQQIKGRVYFPNDAPQLSSRVSLLQAKIYQKQQSQQSQNNFLKIPTPNTNQQLSNRLPIKAEKIVSTRSGGIQCLRWLDMNVIQRNDKWNIMKKEKTLALQKQKFQDEILECTFKPATSTSNTRQRLSQSVTTNSRIKKSSNFYASPNSSHCNDLRRDLRFIQNKNSPNIQNSQILSKSSRGNSQSFRPVSYSDIFKSKQILQKNKHMIGFNDTTTFGKYDQSIF